MLAKPRHLVHCDRRYQNRLRRPQQNVGLTQNAQPFWKNAQAAALQKGCGRNREILSPFGARPGAAQALWALKLARRNFPVGVLVPKMVPMGSVSDTYRPMPVPKSAEETPEKCRPDAKSSALLETCPCGSPLEGLRRES